MQSAHKINPAIVALIAIVLVGLCTAAVVTWSGNGEDTPQQQESTDVDQYKDGAYQAEGEYLTPRGNETIRLTISITDDQINEAIVLPEGKSLEAKDYQSRFISNYKEHVIGKKINEVKLSRIAGSSLTSIGFNNALNQIKKDATK